MKKYAIPFAALQRALEGLGFVETQVPGSHLVFARRPEAWMPQPGN
jgi:hypothetical protein